MDHRQLLGGGGGGGDWSEHPGGFRATELIMSHLLHVSNNDCDADSIDAAPGHAQAPIAEILTCLSTILRFARM